MATLTDAQRAAGWKIVKLGDIAEIVMGTSPKGETVVDYPAGFPLLNGPSEFTDKYPQPVKWTEAGIRFSKPGDILFCVRATLGKMNFSDRVYAIGRGLAAIRGESVESTLYIYYVFNAVMDEVISHANGTIYLSLTKSDINNIFLPYPPENELGRIVSILGSLDDKIEANNRIIQTVSDISVKLVDNLDMFTATPNGVLSDIIEFSPRVRKPQGKEEYQYIDMNALPTQGAVISNILKKGSWTGAKFENGDTLLARITPCLENGKAALAMGLGSEPGCGSTEFIVMRAKSKDFLMLPYGISRSEPFRERAIALMSGSTGRQRVKWQDLAALPIRIPSEEELARIGNIRSFFRQLENLRDENIALSNMRNLLIKKLIG